MVSHAKPHGPEPRHFGGAFSLPVSHAKPCGKELIFKGYLRYYEKIVFYQYLMKSCKWVPILTTSAFRAEI